MDVLASFIEKGNSFYLQSTRNSVEKALYDKSSHLEKGNILIYSLKKKKKKKKKI